MPVARKRLLQAKSMREHINHPSVPTLRHPARFRDVKPVWDCNASRPWLVRRAHPRKDRVARLESCPRNAIPLLVTWVQSCRLRLVSVVILPIQESPRLVTQGLLASSPITNVCSLSPDLDNSCKSRLRTTAQLVSCSRRRLGKRRVTVFDLRLLGVKASKFWSTAALQWRHTCRKDLTSESDSLANTVCRMPTVKSPQVVLEPWLADP
jgi:hypothetical protein